MEYRFIRIDSSEAIAGDLGFETRLPNQFRALFAAKDEETISAVAQRAVGQFVSARGSFTFEKDPITSWMQKADPTQYVLRRETEPVRRTEAMLGSITLEAFVLTYSEDRFVSFWIETSEGEKRRVLSSQISEDGIFKGAPDGFTFTPEDLARAIVAQY